MKQLRWIGLGVLALLSTPVLAETTGNVNFFLGQKTLDSTQVAPPYDEQVEVGFLIDVRGETWPVSIAIDLLGSAHTESSVLGDLTGSTSELDLGIRKVFDFSGSSIHPYVGGGVASLSGRTEYAIGNLVLSEQDSGSGVWLNGGVYITLGDSFNLGLDLRHSQGDITLSGKKINAGGSHAGIMLGYHW